MTAALKLSTFIPAKAGIFSGQKVSAFSEVKELLVWKQLAQLARDFMKED